MAGAWLANALRAILASFRRALRQGVRHGNWPVFSVGDLQRDEEFDFATQSGAYAYRRIRRQHEALMRESDRPLANDGFELFP